MGRKVVCVVGTRPEAVKMAPVILRLRRESAGMGVRVVATGQHRGLLDRALADFGLAADVDLDLMRPEQSLPELSARLLIGLGEVFARERPDFVLAQGDTTTVFMAALASHYARVPFGHVEAGLRTGKATPFPEEKNRVLTTHLAALHFAPTEWARRNLLREGIADATIYVTGNPVIDALQIIGRKPIAPPIPEGLGKFLLVTAHRRESLGPPLASIALALTDLVRKHPDLGVVWPVHPNPGVRAAVAEILKGVPRIHLIEPVGYPEFVALLKAATLILTDSGGVQEEAPTLGKPVLVLRDETERPEAVEAGAALLVGTDRAAIVRAVQALWDDPAAYARYARAISTFGDGRASDRIAAAVVAYMEANSAECTPAAESN